MKAAEPGRAKLQHAVLALAALALLAIGLASLILYRQRGPIEKLAALAPSSARLVEPRLTGGFRWAAYGGPKRANDTAKDATQLKLGGTAGEIIEQANVANAGADEQHAAGVALVVVQQPAEAIPRLERAAEKSKDAKVWSDLAAARYAAASQLGRASLYPTALAAADHALQLDPALPEALFNRALILDRLGLIADARRAWQRAIDVDPGEEWAAEARTRMTQLPTATKRSHFEQNRARIELVAERGDTAALREYVNSNRELARRDTEAMYLGRWADAVQGGNAADATHWLTIARAIGAVLAEVSGEGLLRDAVRTIDGATPAEQKTIAAAHVLYRSGRIAISRGEREVGERDLLAAAEAFESTHDPMALQARFYAGAARLSANDLAGGRAALERVLEAANAHPNYLSLGAHTREELGRAVSATDDWPSAARIFGEAAEMFARAGEHASEGFAETNLAFALTSLGRNDDAWLARMRSFAAMSVEGYDVQRLATGIAAAASAELAAGHHDAALALMDTEASIATNPQRPQDAIDGLITRALLQTLNGDDEAALQTVRRAGDLAQATPDPELRAHWTANVRIAAGAALAERDPRAAAEALTQTIDYYASRSMPAPLLDPLLLRARCAARAGDSAAALRDLDRGMSIVESHPAGAPGTMTGWGVLDAEHAVFTDAIRLALERGDNAGAFALAERSHRASTSVTQLQRRLAGTDTAVLELVALPDELVAFAVAANDFAVSRRPVAAAALASWSDDSLSESGTAAAAKLYDELLRPAGDVLDRARAIVVVADSRLVTVPFAALFDSASGRFAVERWAIASAANAGSLEAATPHAATPALTAIALPTGGNDSVGLPDAENELHDVVSLYARATPLPGATSTFAQFQSAAAKADVVHIAGHTEQQTGGGEQALLFAGAAGKLERVSWKTVVASPALHGVIVLAACETLRPPSSSATHALSLGAAFAAAGASDVVGTLTPVGDRDARVLFRALHRQLAAGADPAAALRAVQQDAIAQEKGGGNRAWRAIALMTRRIPSPPR